jgi:hypothetical protein
VPVGSNPARNVAFLSYAHRDNDLDRGRVRGLADDIIGEFELMTGEPLQLFVDSSSIEWGQEWRSQIDAGLHHASFLIAIVSPLYLRSPECRREFLEFAELSRSRPAGHVILPILYAGIDRPAGAGAVDEVADRVRRIQYEDWRSLRLTSRTAPAYRQAVHRLAERLVQLVTHH